MTPPPLRGADIGLNRDVRGGQHRGLRSWRAGLTGDTHLRMQRFGPGREHEREESEHDVRSPHAPPAPGRARLSHSRVRSSIVTVVNADFKSDEVRVRPGRPDESAILADMANDLNEHVGIYGRPFTAERVRTDGFGAQAAFTPLVAELDGSVV